MTRSRGRLLVVATAVAVLALLVILINREGPDRTITGTITSVESHRVCVAASAGSDRTCVGVDSPQEVANLSSGDCVRMRYSAQSALISVAQTSGCG